MKKIVFIIFMVGATLTGNAQLKQEIERADSYFERAFYSDAIPLYQDIAKKDRSYEVLKNLGDSYYFTNNMPKAANVYKYILETYSNKADDEYYFKYAHTLKAAKEYEEANTVMRQYYEKKGNKTELEAFEASVTYLNNVLALGDRFKIKNLEINTSNSEFGAVVHDYKLVFAASKKENHFLNKLYKWDSQNYLDLYEVPLSKINLGDSIAKSIPGDINTKLHESNAVFTKDGNTVYFTGNNYKKGKRITDNDEITHLQIYKADLVDGEWKNVTSLPFNEDEYSNEHPALSPDEKTLYFASDRPGGHGSFDIYSVSVHNDGSFGAPKNLGPEINTDKKEQFPFITNTNELYFSSNGHPGFGSLDVFVSTLSDTGFSKPHNIGFPVNSGYDDFAFTIDPESKEGFFSSNRPEGRGSDDIYQFTEIKPFIIEDCKQFISGTIRDAKTLEILPNALVLLINSETNELNKATTDTEGKFSFNAQCNTNYVVSASKKGYTENQKSVVLLDENNKNNDASLTLKPLEQTKEDDAVTLEKEKAREQDTKIAAAAQADKSRKERAKEIIAKEKNIVEENGTVFIKTGEIYFDYSLWYIRRDVKKILNEIIELMHEYPEMTIEVSTHTDIRGNARYNLDLSEKRANSVKEYLVENGIAPKRVVSKGYGESQPLVYCATEEACTEEQHEVNRRCIFVVKSF